MKPSKPKMIPAPFLLFIIVLWNTQASAALELFASSSQTSTGGFSFSSNTFSVATKSGYSSGRFLAGENGGFVINLGGIDNTVVSDMSGGWIKDFRLLKSANVTIHVRFSTNVSSTYEFDEYSQVLCSVDKKLFGIGPNAKYLEEIYGTGSGKGTEIGKPPIISSLKWVNISVGFLSAGNHRLILGAYNNKKTYFNEEIQVTFTDVSLQYVPISVPLQPFTKIPTKAPIKKSPVPITAPINTPVKFAPVSTPIKFPVLAPILKVPVKTPIKEPTTAPVKQAPVILTPFKVPVLAPIQKVPVPTPNKAPVKPAPVQAPMLIPIKLPVMVPIKTPTRKPPESVPIQSPIKIPILPPTQKVPVTVPNKAPVKVPVRSPMAATSKSPIRSPFPVPYASPIAVLPPSSPTTSTDTEPYTIRINAGSVTDYIAPNGDVWISDKNFRTNGQVFNNCPFPINGTDLDELYCKERFYNKWLDPTAKFQYVIPVNQIGTYLVKLHFAETYYDRPKERIFDVLVNGNKVVKGLDIFSRVGFATALVIPTTVQLVTSSQIVIEFVGKIENPKISGIEVIELTSAITAPTTAPVLRPVEILINCGGSSFDELYTDRTWEADQYYIGGMSYNDGSTKILNTVDDPLYQTERYGEFRYEIPVPMNGQYTIVLHFAELFWNKVGQRLFNIYIEKNFRILNYDILSRSGMTKYKATTFKLENVTISDQFVSIALSNADPQVDHPKLSGIEILGQ
jgi:hypothetical protein